MEIIEGEEEIGDKERLGITLNRVADGRDGGQQEKRCEGHHESPYSDETPGSPLIHLFSVGSLRMTETVVLVGSDSFLQPSAPHSTLFLRT